MSLESDIFEKDLFGDDESNKAAELTPKKPMQQENSKYINKVYWAFIEKKRLKYSHQFPRMRENQVTNKLLREWDALSTQDKLELGLKYGIAKKQEEDEDSEYHEDSRSEEHKISDKITLQREFTEIMPPEMIKLDLDDSGSLAKVQGQDLKSEESSSEDEEKEKAESEKQIGTKAKVRRTKKTKPIKKPEDLLKLNNGEYLLFYRLYSQKLKSQHPKWTAVQVDHIVKLMWKKKQQTTKQRKIEGTVLKKEANQTSKATESKRPISGKEYFTKEKKRQMLTKEEIDVLWKKLPRESKNDWNKRGAMLGQAQSLTLSKGNTKAENLLKTEGESNKKTSVITFKDVLTKGGFREEEDGQQTELILEEKDEHKKRPKKQKQQQKTKRKEQPEQKGGKAVKTETVQMKVNPLSFMKKKMEKILLE